MNAEKELDLQIPGSSKQRNSKGRKPRQEELWCLYEAQIGGSGNTNTKGGK